MKVCELGEFGLIEILAQIADEAGAGCRSRPDLIIGIGDDAAAWRGKCSVQIGTTDILVQDVHFTLETTTWRDLGWKALAVNISDIAAMGGLPAYAMISLGLPSDTEVEGITQLYTGMAEIARQFDVAIVGGDISEAPLLIISPSVIGRVEKDKMLIRSGAVPGDQIAVTGYLGSSAGGLRVMKQKPELDPIIASALSEAHLRPWPRVAEGQLLGENGVKAAIDISDGLIADLTHICRASGVEARVRLPDIPIHPAVKAAFGEDAITLALSGGEDYELLFTAPGGVMEKVKQSLSIPVTVIGEITGGKPGKVTLLDETGREVEWKKRGWEHFGNY
ncbi:MAG: Thiamine-monophosphate kinase [Dehalococcoidia bacterium]|nr:Thiamine-monophosphate kinase [Chloroflexota bacterium]